MPWSAKGLVEMGWWKRDTPSIRSQGRLFAVPIAPNFLSFWNQLNCEDVRKDIFLSLIASPLWSMHRDYWLRGGRFEPLFIRLVLLERPRCTWTCCRFKRIGRTAVGIRLWIEIISISQKENFALRPVPSRPNYLANWNSDWVTLASSIWHGPDKNKTNYIFKES